MTGLLIAYPSTATREAREELIEATPVGPVEGDHYVLRAHSIYIPLSPGDVVRAPDGMVSEVVSCADGYVVEVFMEPYVDDPQAEYGPIFERWKNDVPATVWSPLSIRLRASKEWVDANVVPLKGQVAIIDVLRRPGQRVDVGQEVDKR